jgi:hypothetical protein
MTKTPSKSKQFQPHHLNPFILYSEELHSFAKNAKSFWLTELVVLCLGSEQFRNALANDPGIYAAHFWTIKVTQKKSVTLEARINRSDEPFMTAELAGFNRPPQEFEIWSSHSGENWTLYLPNEQ